MNPPREQLFPKTERQSPFQPDRPGLDQIKTTVAHEGRVLVSVIGPARVVATITPAIALNGNIILFESPDITTLYSQYRQSR